MKERNVLVIVDDESVRGRLVKSLKKLDHYNIHSFKDANSALRKFRELVNSNKLPSVFLDNKLPDTNVRSVFTQLLSIHPDTEVISETDVEFEKLKRLMDTIEGEQTSESKNHDPRQQIDSLLKSSTRITVERLSQYTNSDRDKVLSYLQKQASDGKALHLDDIKEIACNNCGSVKITQEFYCPNCNSINFKQEKLVEHYSCANISPIGSYHDNKCPKCGKQIEVIGVDYGVMENFFTCKDCSNKFPEPASNFLCLKCNNKFKTQEAKWITSPGFKSVN